MNFTGQVFQNPVFDAQSVFRTLLLAFAEPGLEASCPVAPFQAGMPSTMVAAALTLLDYETTLYLGETYKTSELEQFFSFHTGTKFTNGPKEASFAMVSNMDEALPLDRFAKGLPDYPDRSTTLIISVPAFGKGVQVQLKGPGIKTTRLFAAEGLDREFWTQAIANSQTFPLGVDFIFCGPRSFAALPRSTSICFYDEI